MRNFTVDSEFRDKIPPLSAEEFSKLEENILADGEVREPLVIWNNTIIDGHHRWQIIQKHPEIPFKVKQMTFADKWAAIAWMCKNQLGRRNLTDEQKTYLLGKQTEAEKMTHGGDRNTPRNESGRFTANLQNDGLRLKSRGTAGRIAEEHNVSVSAVERAEQFAKGLDEAEKVSPGIKESVLSGEVKAPKNVISEIRKLPEEKKTEVVEAIKRKAEPYELRSILQDKPYNPVPNATPIVQTEAYNLDDFREELTAIVKNADSCFKQTLVLAHKEMLETPEGRNTANGVLLLAHNMIRKYEELVKEESTNGGV